MPELRCTVQTCTHNKNFCCALDGIVVGGRSARRVEDTCCDSFEERKGDSYSNAVGDASPASSIDCHAADCMYNEECKCHAGRVVVEGGSACRCGQTECATFQCGCQ